MKQICAKVCVLFAALLTVASHAEAGDATAVTSGRVLLRAERITELKQAVTNKTEPTYAAWLKVKQAADEGLARKPAVPAVWHVPGFYGNKEGHIRAKEGLMNDANTAYTLALAYQITGDDAYGAAAAKFILAWTQLKELKQGDDSKLCFSYHFPAMVFAADLIRGSRHFDPEGEKAFSAFLEEKALPMNTMSSNNNWGNWGLVLFSSIAAYQNNAKRLAEAEERWKKLLDQQVGEDGSLTHEIGRNGGRSGMWYSHFSLFPQTIAAEVLRTQGRDLYDYKSPKGRTLRMAYEKLASWSANPESFARWKGDPKELHGRDYFSYFEILYSRWPSREVGQLLVKNRPLTARHSLPWLTFKYGVAIESRNEVREAR